MTLFRFFLTCSHPNRFIVMHEGKAVIQCTGKDIAMSEANHSLYRDHIVYRWCVYEQADGIPTVFAFV